MTSNPSAGVRLEVAILADQTTSADEPAGVSDEPVRLTVLVLAAEADVRRYVRECLRDCVDVRVLDAASIAVASSGIMPELFFWIKKQVERKVCFIFTADFLPYSFENSSLTEVHKLDL